ncbi:MAG: elongation factor P--(R)-beta-lysine ligase [Pirellulaceae bacterium]|nr:MAG: elongation factor P--(R)-beta-lysine ligase [Pirellulaceae bacterium]
MNESLWLERLLEKRAALLRSIRNFFDSRGFLEVETPLLCREVVVDRHLDPYPVTMEFKGESDSQLVYYLQTSPEYGMKRLLSRCPRSFYQITRAFRRFETGTQHNTEFTIVEWYEVGADYEKGMQTTADLAEAILGRGQAERLSYREALMRYAGVDPWTVSVSELRERAIDMLQDCSLNLSDRDAWLELLLTMCVQKHLGTERPTILYDYPASQAALAQVRPGNPPVAERFELYVDGWELANGYHELRDAEELLRRMQQNNEARIARGAHPLPIPMRLVEAQRGHFPACVGVALGFDRLVAVALGIPSVQKAMVFPIDEA